jgi:predicted dinucleotide-binding enzyme
VVKALNTTLAATVASGAVAEAKSQLADVLNAGGLRAIDAGSLRRARELEALAFLQITLAAQDKLPWTGGFAVVA